MNSAPLSFARLRLLSVMLAVTAALTLSDCSAMTRQVRPDAAQTPRTETYAIAPDATTSLGGALAPQIKQHPGLSGFRLLITGNDAFFTRLALIRSAQRTLDIQYYNVEDDKSSQTLLEETLRAAERGVRVRVLVDNINLENADGLLAVLNTSPNIEVRSFNPVTTADQSFLEKAVLWLGDSERATKRMHNKALIVDNWMATLGGRNLSDEYFDEDSDFNFSDMDALTAGSITQDISRSFDRYWNSKESFPVSRLDVEIPDPEKITKVRQELQAHWRQMAESAEWKKSDIAQPILQLADSKRPLVWARAELSADQPDKVQKDAEENKSPPITRLVELVSKADHEFIAVSPYFVPRTEGVEWFRKLSDRGIKLRILTNSLASTDVPAVHSGYARYREAMLKLGAELYEFKPIPGKRSRQNQPGNKARASLHSKVYVVDRKDLVIGSFNLDPRSYELNTEIALVIHDPVLSRQVVDMFDKTSSLNNSYHVMLAGGSAQGGIAMAPGQRNSKGSALIWRTKEKDTLIEYDSEPNPGPWRSFQHLIFTALPVEDQL